VGTVVSLSDDIDPTAAKWVGYPCLQPFPAGMPISAQGKIAAAEQGRYAAKLWSICNCAVQITQSMVKDCVGPLCDLLHKLHGPIFDMALPTYDMTNLASIMKCAVLLCPGCWGLGGNGVRGWLGDY